MEIFNTLENLKKKNEINEAICAEIHGITDIGAYYNLYYPNTELAPNQFAIGVYLDWASYYEIEKDVHTGLYDYDDYYDTGYWTEVPTEGEGWEFEGDKDLLESQVFDGYMDVTSPAYLYEEQDDLQCHYWEQRAWQNQTGIFAPEISVNLVQVFHLT